MSGIGIRLEIVRIFRDLLQRLPITIFVFSCLFVVFTEYDQIYSLLSERHTFFQTLFLFGISSTTCVTLTILSTNKTGSDGKKIHPVDLVLAVVPVLILSTQVRGFGLQGLVIGIVLAVAMLIFLARRRVNPSESRKFQFWVLLGVFFAWISTFVGLGLSPVALARELGSVAIIFLFIGLLLVLFQLVVSRPYIGTPVLLIAVSIILFNEQDHDLRLVDFTDYDDFEKNEAAIRSPVSIQDAFDKWLASRNDLSDYRDNNQDYPVFLISAEGGGGYAAAHALLFLSKMQERCPNFVQHIFAVTGVSGGAVGNALFFSKLDRETNPESRSGCSNTVDVTNELEILARDNLSPVVGAMLFRDLPNKLLFGLLHGPNRSEVLVSALSGTSGIGDAKNPYFWEHYWELSENGTRRPRGGPAILPIATNLVSGKPYIFAPFELDDLRNGFEQASCGECDLSRGEPDEAGLRTFDVGLFDAAVASASFPYVTPSLGISAFGGSRVGLVDGGYLDNSGSEVLLEIARALHTPNRFFDGASPTDLAFPKSTSGTAETRRCYGGVYDGLNIVVAKRPYESKDATEAAPEQGSEDTDCEVGVRFITITIRAEPSRDRYLTSQNFFTDPISALLNGRSRRAELARLRLFDFQCAAGPICPRHVEDGASVHFLDSVIRPQDFALPLGWKLPEDGIRMMSQFIAPDPDAEIDENHELFAGQREVLAWQADVFESVSGNPKSTQAIISALSP